ncbi:MAG: ABC transporter ATP-binding protein [Firmicutes bacterium]|nr:ABC transporter ATP-binding protein [Bacillota bacterium]
MADVILSLSQVNKTYVTRKNGRNRNVWAVRNVSFDLKRQHIVALVGESGSGKSTIAKLITGVERSDAKSGSILFEQKPLAEWRRHMREYRRHVQMVFQDPYAALNPLNPVNYAVGRPLTNYKKLRGQAREQEIEQILQQVHLTPVREFANKLPFELSGGQLQRVVIARALASSPKLIVADEPVSMLDVSIRAEVIGLIDELRTQAGVSFLYITHDLISARLLADEIVVLYRGTVVESGDAKTVVREALHPYTQLLLQAIPNPWAPEQDENFDMSLLERTGDDTGCVFRSRCPHAMEACAKTAPTLQPHGEKQQVACLLYSAESREPVNS